LTKDGKCKKEYPKGLEVKKMVIKSIDGIGKTRKTNIIKSLMKKSKRTL
jgi:hypothetical protein